LRETAEFDLLFLPRNISQPKVLGSGQPIERGQIEPACGKGSTGRFAARQRAIRCGRHVGDPMAVSQDVRGQGGRPGVTAGDLCAGAEAASKSPTDDRRPAGGDHVN
jgi:hypothetical protein